MKNVSKIFSFLTLAIFCLLIGAIASVPAIILFLAFAILALLPQPQGALKVVVSNPLIGKSKQSMGNATFTTWKGINVLKEKATSVANPQTDSQLMRRSAFEQMVSAFRQLPAAVRAGFKKLAVKMSEFNAFTSYNLKNAFDYSGAPVATLVPGDVLISKGTIAATPITAATADRSDNTITATYPNTAAQPGQSLTDVAIIGAYNHTKDDWTGGVSAGDRQDGTANVPLPAEWETGDTITVYLGFYNPLSGESSDSVNDEIAIQA